jgi:predicted transcriptional regulator
MLMEKSAEDAWCIFRRHAVVVRTLVAEKPMIGIGINKFSTCSLCQVAETAT